MPDYRQSMASPKSPGGTQTGPDIPLDRAEVIRFPGQDSDLLVRLGGEAAHNSMHWFEAKKRTVLIVDIVESVRLIQRDERASILNWLAVVDHVEGVLLKQFQGRLVKSLGDGLLLEFERMGDALKVAFGIQDFSRDQNATLPDDRKVLLRMGLDTGDIIGDSRDVYGHSVNLAARLTTLADPGEIVVSAAGRDQLTPEVDAEIEDMGECFLKHVVKPVRAYKVFRPGTARIKMPVVEVDSILPTIAVIPFKTLQSDDKVAIGHILAEELIRTLSASPHLNVISRLSTAPFATGDPSMQAISDHLNANHVLSGRAVERAGKLVLSLDLTETRTMQVIWADQFTIDPAAILGDAGSVQSQIAEEVSKAILKRELQRARTLPVRSLESYTLLLGAINAMHRLSVAEFQRAHEMLEAVIDRNPRQSVPLAWMGNWHFMKVQQGWSTDKSTETEQAEGYTNRALDLNPDCDWSLTFDGLVKGHMQNHYDEANERYVRALEQSPNNSMAWLLKGTVGSFQGQGEDAIGQAVRGQNLSPLDPQTYYYDCLIGGCYAAAGRYDEAKQHLERSLRLNAHHTSTLRVLSVVQWCLGDEDGSRKTMQRMLALQPGLTVSNWKRTYGLAQSPYGQIAAEIFEKAGMPVN